MATITLRPNGTGHSTGLTSNGGANWAAVDEAVADDDTTYVAGSVDSTYDLYTTPGGIPSNAPINSVTFYARARHTGSFGFGTFVFRVGTDEDVITSLILGSSYALADSGALTTNPITSAAWTEAEVNAMEIGIMNITSSPAMRCTQLYAVVDYDEPITTTLASELAAVVFTAGSVTQAIPSTVATQIAKVVAEINATHTPNLTPTVETQVAKAVASLNAFHGTDPALIIGAVLAKVAAEMTATKSDDATIAATLANIEAALQTDVDTASLLHANRGHGFRSGSPHFRGGR